jgi:transposase
VTRPETDRRDCRRLARLHRASELVAIRIPSPEEEAVRDLCRTRADMVQDLTRARNRLGKFLLRHGRPWRGGSTRTHAYQVWLGSQRFDQPAMTQTFGHYLAVVEVRNQALDAVEADLAGWCDRPPFAWQVARLGAYRGVTRLGALTLAAEVADWRRFASANAFMGFCGLVPSEYSSGNRVHRGRLTKAGNAHLRAQLVESAWSYQHRPSVGVEIARRRQGLDPAVIARAWAAQQRLSGRFRTLATRKHTKSIVAAAIARELAGFLGPR